MRIDAARLGKVLSMLSAVGNKAMSSKSLDKDLSAGAH